MGHAGGSREDGASVAEGVAVVAPAVPTVAALGSGSGRPPTSVGGVLPIEGGGPSEDEDSETGRRPSSQCTLRTQATPMTPRHVALEHPRMSPSWQMA